MKFTGYFLYMKLNTEKWFINFCYWYLHAANFKTIFTFLSLCAVARESWWAKEKEGSILGADQKTGARGGDPNPPVGPAWVLDNA